MLIRKTASWVVQSIRALAGTHVLPNVEIGGAGVSLLQNLTRAPAPKLVASTGAIIRASTVLQPLLIPFAKVPPSQSSNKPKPPCRTSPSDLLPFVLHTLLPFVPFALPEHTDALPPRAHRCAPRAHRCTPRAHRRTPRAHKTHSQSTQLRPQSTQVHSQSTQMHSPSTQMHSQSTAKKGIRPKV